MEEAEFGSQAAFTAKAAPEPRWQEPAPGRGEEAPAGGWRPLLAVEQSRLNEGLARARRRLLSLQSPQGYWVFDLESDSTIPSEFIMLQRFLGREIAPELRDRLTGYLRARQLPEGGWPLFEGGLADLSASVKAYFALKLLGDSYLAPHMVKARRTILGLGGAAGVNVFTRISLALFGQIPWRTAPAMPVEIMLLPTWFFFHLQKVSYWSRTVLVPLLILYAKRPVCRLRPGEGVAELFLDQPESLRHLDGFSQTNRRKNFFLLLDRVLKRIDPLWPPFLRARALRRAENWTLERMQGEGGLGAIFPAMANAVMALKTLGYPEDHPDFLRGIQALDDLVAAGRGEARGRFLPGPYPHGCTDHSAALDLDFRPDLQAGSAEEGTVCQPCHSPIWDTCLSMSAMLEAGIAPGHPLIARSVEWLFSKQIHVEGDWRERVRNLESGGWAFQFENTFYPDVDDTAMVLMALLRADVLQKRAYRQKITKAVNWILGMQCRDGGWGAFDIDNNHLYLNDIPFADHGALLDPSTSDLTARCIEMLSMLGYGKGFSPIDRGIDFLRREQEESGAWYGRWGVNYIYGTWSVLSALRQVGEEMSQSYVVRAADWLTGCQNADGGWGETCNSYDDPSLAGRGISTPSQTAWALLGLMAAGRVNCLAVRRGVRYLLETQDSLGCWEERSFTGTGFPRVFYLRYHGYSKYFPLWALGVYGRLCTGKRTCQDEKSLHIPFPLPRGTSL